VPTYGVPGNSFSSMQVSAIFDAAAEFLNDGKAHLALENFLGGYFHAYSDYRVFVGTDEKAKKPYLHNFSECLVGNPVEQFEFEGKKFSRSSLNYILGLAFLKKHLGNDEPRTVLEIGGGFGTLGEILSTSGIADFHYIDIDIPPAGYVAEYYLGEALGKENIFGRSAARKEEEIVIEKLPAITVLPPWYLEKLSGSIDLFVNFISFQEMEPDIVKNYLSHVIRLDAKWILLRNMREGKQKKTPENGIGVITPIISSDYIDMLPNYHLIDQNVIPYGYKTVDGFHSELLLFRRRS